MSSHPTHPLLHPEVLHAITSTLRKRGLRKDEIPDGVGEVQTRALEATRSGQAPTETSGWAKLCTTIATCFAIDEGRKRIARARTNVGLCEDPDEYAPLARSGDASGAVDAGRQLAVLGTLASPDQRALLECVAAGMTYKEIAVELGLTEHAVRDGLSLLRKRFRLRLAALGMTALMLLATVLLALPRERVGVEEPRALPAATPAPTPTHSPTPEERASVVRQEALQACAVRQWAVCAAKLDEAGAMDPAGDSAPEVESARDRAEKGMVEEEREMEAKPR